MPGGATTRESWTASPEPGIHAGRGANALPIHPTAIIHPSAEIDPNADIGPYVIVDGPVNVAAGTRIYPHVYLTGHTEIGPDCQVHPFASVGHLPQDTNHKGERTYCRIGRGTVLREYVSVHRGTQPESTTIVGADCLLFAGSHVAHNCQLADRVTLINGALLAGHVTVGERAVISGNAAAHQFVRIGECAMAAGMSTLSMDVPPFMTMLSRNLCSGVNLVGMRRAGLSREEIREIRDAYRILYRTNRAINTCLQELKEMVQTPAGRRLWQFLEQPSKRGIGIGARHAYRRSVDIDQI
jgi:UDP-N-acetylglucosamine acyltransferase